ncbi:MAG: glycosyltransferase [Candidatus Glassbacteria bacterium]|nr:glycosyltransferase [Candidatus Glassbacteria bacterium]
MKPQIFFYIPVRNEEETAGVLLYRLMQSMREVDMEYEVHLTLDGCSDDSAQVVEPYLKKMPLLVTHHQSRRGYSKCLKDAIRKISGTSQNPKRDYFVVLDADFSFDPAELKEMAPGIERNVVLYVPDRINAPGNRLGVAKRIANRLAAGILRRRGARFPANIDLLSTVRACRVQHLRRNMPRMDAFSMLPAATPPAVSGAMLYLALQDNSRKTEILEIREQKMSRRPSRFSLLGVLKRLMFGPAVKKVIEHFERGGREGGRDRSRDYRRSRRGSGEPGRQEETRTGSRRSRGGRSRRRGRRSGGGGKSQGGEDSALSDRDRPSSGGGQGDRKAGGGAAGKAQSGDSGPGSGGRSGGRRSRRRRRRPNKRTQGSSNSSPDQGSKSSE